MATKSEKQQLIDTLKFTPRTYRIMLQGYGGECYAGKVDRKIYEYFREQKIDIAEYASAWEGFDDMPREMKPFEPGAPFECDGLFHASGMELSDLNEVEVYDENDNVVWSCVAGHSELEDAGVTVECGGGEDLDDLEEGEVVFWGGQGEKGCFFDGEIYLKAPFDPKKLTVYYENCDGWYIVNTVEYDGEYIEGTDGYSTTGKWGDAKWRLGGDEEPYDEVVSVEDREDEGLTWDITHDNDSETVCSECDEPDEDTVSDDQKTEWIPAAIKPVHVGRYECQVDKIPTWPWPNEKFLIWNGKSWQDEDGEKVGKPHAWRGLKEQTV